MQNFGHAYMDIQSQTMEMSISPIQHVNRVQIPPNHTLVLETTKDETAPTRQASTTKVN